MKNFTHSETNKIRLFECACVCACRYYTQELTFFDVSKCLQNKKIFFISGFSIFSRECAGKSATRKTCFPSLESMSWRRISNQMNILNQSKQSVFSSIFLSCFHFFPAFFKIINFFIYYLKSGQEIFINKFNKAMKEKMKLESKSDTLTAGLGCRMMHGRLIDQTDWAGSAAELRGRQSLPNSLKKNQKNFTDILEHGILSRWFNYDIEYDLADKKSGKQGMRHYRGTLNNVS